MSDTTETSKIYNPQMPRGRPGKPTLWNPVSFCLCHRNESV